MSNITISPSEGGPPSDRHDQLIDGGSVESIDANSYGETDRKESENRGKLAVGLVLLLSGLLLMQYVAICVLEWGDKAGAMKSLEAVFNASLPLVAGLVSSAVTYYFTRNNRRG